MQLSEVLSGLRIREVLGPVDREVGVVTRDSREGEEHSVFVAIEGERVDGHDFVDRTGAGVVVVGRPVAVRPGATRVLVADTRVALAHIASAIHGHPWRDVPVVGVTGTNGKTTVTSLVHGALEAIGHRVGRVGTLGTSFSGAQTRGGLTTPEAPELMHALAAMRGEDATAAVLEASSIGLDQRRLDGIRFHAAVFTSFSGDHLDYHGTMSSYAKAKSRLFGELLREEGGLPRALLCADDPGWRKMDPPADRWLYGQSADAELRAEDVSFSASGAQFWVRRTGGSSHRVQVGLLGLYNVLNATAAWGVLLLLGVSEASAAEALCLAGSVPGRSEHIEGAGGRLVVVDYAHSDAALDVALRGVRAATQGEIWVVFGAGGDRDAKKRPRMGATAEALANHVVVTTDNARGEDPAEIARAIVAGMQDPGRAIVELDRAAAIRHAIEASKPGDAVLIAGKGHETTQWVGDQARPFDDRAEARRVLESL